MKKLNKLFAILFAVLGVTTLKAQTDVTSLYLTNADFEGSYKSVYEIKNDGRYIYKPEGWTVDYVNKSTWNMTVVGSTDANAAATFKDTYAIPADNNRYMVRFRDNQPTEYVDLSQTITIKESGTYTFSADLIREDGSKVDVSLYVGETSVSNATPAVWENRSFAIALSAGDVVKVGLKFRNIAAGGNKLGADNVKIAFEPINTSEQSWIAPVVGVNLNDVNNNTELYMYNVKADAFAASGMSWGTHAIVKELQNGDSKLSADVHRCRVSKPTDGQLQIMLNERTFLGGGGPASTNDCWVDHGSNNIYIYNEVSTNVYTLKPTTATTDSYLDCSWKYGGHITFSATNGYGNTEWAFVLRSDITSGKYLLYKAKKEMYDIYAAVKEAGHDDTYAEALAIANVAYNDANATAATINAATKALLANVAPALTSGYFSANSLFKNPDMRGYGDDTDWGNGLNAFGDGIFESWHSSETITQKQTELPNGFYTVEFIGIYRQDGGDAAPTLTLTSGSNSAKANLKALTEIDFGNCSGGNKWTGANKPDDKYSAGEALAHTDANVKVENFFVENGELTVTVAMPSGSQWLLCQGFRISFKAESLEQYANLFNEAKEAADAIDVNTLNTYAKNTLTTALNNAATVQINKEWYQARTAELNNAVTIANDVATAYPKASALLTICNDILNNSVEFENGAKKAFSDIVSETDVEAATTADAINDIYNTLETARQTYVKQADPTNGVAFDYTFLVVNPGFDNGKTGWESTGGAQNKAIATNKANGIITGTFFENWNPSNFTGEIYQTISNLPSGIYKLKVAAYGAGTNVYANDKQTAVTTSDGAWYEVDQVKVGEGTLKFGIKNENATNWMGIDNASLEYYGFDVPTAQSAITSMVAEAGKFVGKPMNAGIASALQAAIDGADATAGTRNELTPMIDALNAAIDAAKASISEYEKIAQYIAKANKIGESIAKDYQTQYDNRELTTAVEVFQALEVETYDYVTSNFTYEVALSNTWNSTGTNTAAADFNDEHWSGETRSYKNQKDGDNWGWGAQSWSIDFDQEVTLPAGEYVFKVAGRKSVDATLELVVTMGETELGTVNDFPSSNEALGINKAGATSFDADDPAGFAKDGKGYGWQWRYVRFELNSKSTVKVAVHAETNAVHNWVSFGDYTLQMTEETYLAANMHGLDEPTAAANALVDTKPMGTAENKDLRTALDMPVTTGAELQAKITALEAAVANAKAWIPLYNEAKVPLAAALERFEADFNLGDGLHGYMKDGLWANVIEMVKAAAIAKDVTDSYEGFADAADNLNTALDAAQASINMYANLAAEISYAKGYTPIVEGNVDAHNAAITAAENAYNTAEIDDASALIFAMQNFRTLDYEHVKGTYTSEVTLGNWSGKTNQSEKGKSEHWSGDANQTYFDYSKWAPEHNNGANEATQTVTLPAGEYVLMAAGRAATVAGTEAYIKVNETKVNFAAKGAYGYGIATDGTANFAADGTYGRDNEGYGWEYRFIEFTLTEETEVTLVAGMTIDVNTADLSWASVCTPVLYTTALDAAKQNLQKAITDAQNKLEAYPVGEEAFQVSTSSDLYIALDNAIGTAQSVLTNATTAEELNEAIEPLNTAVSNYTDGYVLNAPAEGQRFNIVLVYAGWTYDGKAMTYIAGDRKDHGGYNIKYKAAPNTNYAQAFTFTPVADRVNHYTMSMTDVDGNERYVCTGTVYGGNASQIRTTTDAGKALAVKVIATSTNGIWNLYNTEANNYIGSQDEGVYTVNSHINFNLVEAKKAEVTLTISSVGWATLILPFNAELPEGVVAYESDGVTNDAVLLKDAESLVANTPYLVKSAIEIQKDTKREIKFSGYGLADKDSYEKELFVGTYVQKKAEAGSYVLQNPKDEEGNPRGLGFYLVAEGKQPTVGAYRSYMKAQETKTPMFRIGGTTDIDNMESTDNGKQPIVIYDLMGRKVTTMEKGNMYIINGRKVIVK